MNHHQRKVIGIGKNVTKNSQRLHFGESYLPKPVLTKRSIPDPQTPPNSGFFDFRFYGGNISEVLIGSKREPKCFDLTQ